MSTEVSVVAFTGGTLPCILRLYSLQSLLNRRIKDRNTLLSLLEVDWMRGRYLLASPVRSSSPGLQRSVC
jgi:hypothetical protein